MHEAIQYREDLNMFWYEYRGQARLLTLIQAWNMGIHERHLQAALREPDQFVNLSEAKAVA